MLNLNDLEARHRKYKLKSYVPYALFTGILLITIITLISYDNKPQNIAINEIKEKPKVQIIKKSLEINTSKDTTVIIKPELKKPTLAEKEEPVIEKIEVAPEVEKVKLSPSLDFMRNMQPTNVYMFENEQVIQNDTNKIEVKKIIKEEVIEEDIIEEEEPILIIKKKDSIKINRNNDIDEIKHVIRRFKVNNNPALSLFIAKKYYQIGKYRKSYNYSLITNQINNNIEASWIIFAKSLMKLDEQDMAVKTLKKYIDHSHSNQAKILLDEIQSGKFK